MEHITDTIAKRLVEKYSDKATKNAIIEDTFFITDENAQNKDEWFAYRETYTEEEPKSDFIDGLEGLPIVCPKERHFLTKDRYCTVTDDLIASLFLWARQEKGKATTWLVSLPKVGINVLRVTVRTQKDKSILTNTIFYVVKESPYIKLPELENTEVTHDSVFVAVVKELKKLIGEESSVTVR